MNTNPPSPPVAERTEHSGQSEHQEITVPSQLPENARNHADPEHDPVERAFMRGYLKGLNEKAAAELHRPDAGEEPYPPGQHGTPVTPDPFFLPDAYSVWD